MPTLSPSDQLDALYEALSHAKRRGILMTLSFRPATVSQLALEQGLSLPAIHKHIRLMEGALLIRRKKAGRTNFVALRREGLRLAQGWIGQFRAEWGADGETLENYIATLPNK